MALLTDEIPRHGAWKAGWRTAWFCLSCSCFFSTFFSFFFFFFLPAKSVVPWRRKGLLPWSLTQYFVCPHSLLNLLFSGFTHTIGGRLGGDKNMWALFYISISAAFSMGWDYAERMLYLLLGCSLWIKAFWCLLSSYSPCVHALKLGTQSL